MYGEREKERERERKRERMCANTFITHVLCVGCMMVDVLTTIVDVCPMPSMLVDRYF